uniref:uncharacterized protein LOC120325893 n=1 Tax=Styela clava TaxID=7725 RepID=UPI00193A69DC|nr:uncharacterized protein LOC120325893 [Styela clava]
MKILVVFILIYVTTSSWCQDETVFHCSPKPGCQIAQCDPVAVGWDRPGFNIDEHLHDKEFPITCKPKNAKNLQNTVNLFSLMTRNTLDIGHIKSDLRDLEENVNDKIKNTDVSEGEESDIKNKEQSKEINNLREKDRRQSEEIKKLKEESDSKFKEQSKEINNLREKDRRQSEAIKELKEDLTKVLEMNINVVENNKKMKKAISRIEQKLSVPTTKSQTTMNQTTLKPTPPPENCKLKIGNICYFALIRVEEDVNYDIAVEYCKKRNADVGLIRDEKSYNAIMDYLRRNIPKEEKFIYILTEIQFNPITRDVKPADSFIEWSQNIWTAEYPITGAEYKDYRNIFLLVLSDLNSRHQGMVNAPSTTKVHGVICEILI